LYYNPTLIKNKHNFKPRKGVTYQPRATPGLKINIILSPEGVTYQPRATPWVKNN